MKIFTHKQQYVVTSSGDVLLFRFSYDKEIIFMRSVHKIEPYIEFDKTIQHKKIPLIIKSSIKSEEFLNPGDLCQNTSQIL